MVPGRVTALGSGMLLGMLERVAVLWGHTFMLNFSEGETP